MVQSPRKFTSERVTKDPSNALTEQQPHSIFLSHQNSFLLYIVSYLSPILNKTIAQTVHCQDSIEDCTRIEEATGSGIEFLQQIGPTPNY